MNEIQEATTRRPRGPNRCTYCHEVGHQARNCDRNPNRRFNAPRTVQNPTIEVAENQLADMEDEEIEDMEAVFGVDAEQDHLDPGLLEDIELLYKKRMLEIANETQIVDFMLLELYRTQLLNL